MATSCIIYGDESGRIGKEKFFAIGVIGTRDPRTAYGELGQIRKQTNFFDEVTYKSSDKRRALCAIKWVDWFFSGQSLLKYKVILKDRANFNARYFEGNAFKAGGRQLAYCETYSEVLNNFADFKDDSKYLVYDQINLEKMDIATYLHSKVKGLEAENCYGYSSKKKKPHSADYTLHSELLQLADLLTSSFRNLVMAWDGTEPGTTDWVKKALHQNLSGHLPELRKKFTDGKNFYWRTYEPYSEQVFTLYNWRNPR